MRRPSQIAGSILVALGATAAADPSALLCDTPLVGQADCPGPGCDAGRDYVAYALRMASLTQEGREALDARRDLPRPVDEARLNDDLLYFKPDVFAAYAWAHFDGSGGSCDFVSRLTMGEVSLGLPEAFD
mgnify:CR=1 FL=1